MLSAQKKGHLVEANVGPFAEQVGIVPAGNAVSPSASPDRPPPLLVGRRLPNPKPTGTPLQKV